MRWRVNVGLVSHKQPLLTIAGSVQSRQDLNERSFPSSHSRVCYTSDLPAFLREHAQGRDLHVVNEAARKTLEAAVSGSSVAQQEGTSGVWVGHFVTLTQPMYVCVSAFGYM